MGREQELLEHIVRELVDNPDQLSITVIEGAKTMTLEVRAEAEDIGKVIGKRGRIIRALRTVMGAAGSRWGKNIVLDVVDHNNNSAVEAE